MKGDVLKRLAALEGPRDGLPRLLLVATGDTFTDNGGRVYSAQEAAELEARGVAELITFKVVYHERGIGA